MTDLTYAQLDEMLRGLGFSARDIDGGARVYKHAGSGALLVLPADPERRVIPHHLATARMTLDAFGIAEPPEFAARLRAG